MSLLFFPEMSADEQKTRQHARELLDREILPTAIEDDRRCQFRRGAFNAFAKAGLTSLAVPKAYGGGGLSAQCHYAALEEMAKGPVAFSVCVAVTNLVQGALIAFGTEAQKENYLRKLVKGESLGAFSLSEPQSGSDAAGLQLKAKKAEGGYRLTGTKCWCSSGGEADIYLVIGRTGEHKSKGITAFLVHKEAKGFKIGKQEKKLGLRASPLTELIFEDCFVPENQRVGLEGEGFSVALSQLDAGRIGIGACGVGIAWACIERMQKALNGDFGNTCAYKEYAGQKLAEFYARLQSVRLLIHTVSLMKDQGKDLRILAAQIKLLGSDLAMEVSSELIVLMGEAGIREELELERYFRDAKALQIVEGTNQIQKLVLAREMEKMV